MLLIKNAWILIFLLTLSNAFPFTIAQTNFFDDADEIIFNPKVTKGKSDISAADLPEFIPGKKIVKLSNYSFTHSNFRTDNSFLVPNILKDEGNIIPILFTSKIIYPFHSFL